MYMQSKYSISVESVPVLTAAVDWDGRMRFLLIELMQEEALLSQVSSCRL